MPQEVPATVIRALNEEVLQQLRLVGQITHPAENGRAREEVIRSFLRRFVPPAFGVDTGFVIDVHGGISKQIDIVIYRTGYHPIFEISGVKHFMVESVAAVIENKAWITSAATLGQALDNVRSAKVLDRTGNGRNYVVMDFHGKGPRVTEEPHKHEVWTAIITQEVLSPETLHEALLADMAVYPRALWLNCFCAIHDLATVHIRVGADGQKTLAHWTADADLFASVGPAYGGESPLIEFAHLLATKLRAVPIIDYDPAKYFPSGMKHSEIADIRHLGRAPGT